MTSRLLLPPRIRALMSGAPCPGRAATEIGLDRFRRICEQAASPMNDAHRKGWGTMGAVPLLPDGGLSRAAAAGPRLHVDHLEDPTRRMDAAMIFCRDDEVGRFRISAGPALPESDGVAVK